MLEAIEDIGPKFSIFTGDGACYTASAVGNNFMSAVVVEGTDSHSISYVMS